LIKANEVQHQPDTNRSDVIAYMMSNMMDDIRLDLLLVDILQTLT
jgi:hypothetical protein